MDSDNRPDLSAGHILLFTATIVASVAVISLWPGLPTPGSVVGQLCATAGALLLLAPMLFVVMKRSSLAASPPTWFVTHVVATLLGCCLIFAHAAAGNWLSPPGLILLLLAFLILQGSFLRAILARGYSLLFARTSAAQGFESPRPIDKVALQQVIEQKTELLRRIDVDADEALFSPALKHWLRTPWKSLQYQRLADREAALIGARAAAGIALGWSRRIHMLAALGFYLGLLAHVVIVLFFAGYAAGGGPVDWWHITAWGG